MTDEKETRKLEDKDVYPIIMNVGKLPSEERADRRKREKIARRAGVVDIFFAGLELIAEALTFL